MGGTYIVMIDGRLDSSVFYTSLDAMSYCDNFYFLSLAEVFEVGKEVIMVAWRGYDMKAWEYV